MCTNAGNSIASCNGLVNSRRSQSLHPNCMHGSANCAHGSPACVHVDGLVASVGAVSLIDISSEGDLAFGEDLPSCSGICGTSAA